MDAEPDRATLAEAGEHAREACQLDPSSGNAWSTLAMVLYHGGDGRSAIAAARKAIAIEPREWHHHLRLAYVSWGAERLRAAQRVQALYPGLALAHRFGATVFVARGAFDAALEYLRAGCAAHDAQQQDASRFKAVGLHLLHGLVLAACGAPEAALEAFQRELAVLEPGHIYARECRANTCYAIGAMHLRHDRRGEARAAFQDSLALVPGNALASVGLSFSENPNRFSPMPQPVASDPANVTVDQAMVRAVVLALQNRHVEAARLCGDALRAADAGSAGWLLPVEPLLQATAHAECWARTLAKLRDRAS
jgi:tetratricopeptide (TPR) repeat protein